MTKNTLKALVSIVTDTDTEDKDAILAELNKELNRGADKAQAKATEYDQAWDIVRGVLAMTATPLTVAEITEEATDLPEGFGKGRVLYGLNHQWADQVVKIEGKPNTYRLA